MTELQRAIEGTDRAGWDLPLRVESTTLPQMTGAFDIVESDVRRTRVAIAGAREDADLVAAALNKVIAEAQALTTCAYDDCEYEVAESVEIALPAFLGPFRLLPASDRERRIPVCAEHASMLKGYFQADGMQLAFQLVDSMA